MPATAMEKIIPGRDIGNGAGVLFSTDEAVAHGSGVEIGHEAGIGFSSEEEKGATAAQRIALKTDDGRPQTRLRAEFSSILELSLPIVVASVLNFLMNLVDLAMIGHLGREQLAAASLGLAFYNTVYFPLSGIAMAFDTLFSQAFGAKNYRLYAVWLLAGSFCLLFFCAIASAILLCANPILLSLQMEKQLSRNAALYVAYLVPGMWPNVGFLVVQKYLHAQKILSPCVYVSAAANVFNFVGNYYLIYVANLGLKGAPVATSLTRAFQFVCISTYLCVSGKHGATWPSRETMDTLGLKHLSEFLVLGLSGWLMIALEAWAFDVGQILAAYLDVVSLGAHSALQTLTGFTYMSFPLALSIAVSIRVGHLLGSGDYRQAQVAMRATVMLTTCFMVMIALTMLILRDFLGYVFSNDEAVVSTFAAIIPIAAFFQVFDGLQSACAGCLRGMGRNSLVAGLNFLGLWVIGTTLGVVLTFFVGTPLSPPDPELHVRERGLGAYGLWWGLAMGLGITSLISLWILCRKVDWPQMAREALVRSGAAGAGHQ